MLWEESRITSAKSNLERISMSINSNSTKGRIKKNTTRTCYFGFAMNVNQNNLSE